MVGEEDRTPPAVLHRCDAGILGSNYSSEPDSLAYPGSHPEVPSLEPKFNDKINWLEELEVFGYSIDLEGLQTILSIEEINRLVTEFIGSLASFTANMLTVLIFLAFIILEAESLPGRVMAAFPNEANRFDNIASKAEKNINVYIKTKATVAFGQALVAWIALMHSTSLVRSCGPS